MEVNESSDHQIAGHAHLTNALPICGNYNSMGVNMRKPDFVAWEQQRCRPACTSKQSDQCLFYSLSGRECSGSVVECLTQDRGGAGSSLTGVTVLWSLSKAHLS